jgi:predicted lysophospholipase L1 biosynthesis ABC-type transport system permease subunit
VNDVHYSNLREPERPLVYLPAAQFAGTQSEPLVLFVRTVGAPGDLTELVQREIRASGQTVAIRNVTEMANAINNSLAYQVAGRTTEIGTRMALGARATGVLWLVMRQSLVLLSIGFVVGVPLALFAARALAAQLFGVSAFDPWSLSGALIVLTLAGVLATLLPARRATRVDPLTALRAS